MKNSNPTSQVNNDRPELTLEDAKEEIKTLSEALSKMDDKLVQCDQTIVTPTARSLWTLTHATTRQRAEALLRIIGKWKD